MEKINTEILVSTLLVAGFQQVDSVLFMYTLGKLSIDNKELNLFEFDDKETTDTFNKYISFDGIVYKLKPPYTLEDNVSPVEKYIIPLKKVLHINKKLLDYLNKLDFEEIILKKLSLLRDTQNLDYLLCQKEKEIIKAVNNKNQNKTLSKSKENIIIRSI